MMKMKLKIKLNCKIMMKKRLMKSPKKMMIPIQPLPNNNSCLQTMSE
jgi:hypothetical protein